MQLPDGPKTPSLFQSINWIAKPFEYIEECGKKYGDIFTLRLLGLPPSVYIANPQGIKEIFSADAKSFDAGRSNDLVRPLVGDNSILLMDRSSHKKERKLLMPPFHGEKVKFYASSIWEITDKVASRWQVNQPFVIRDVMHEITLDVIMQTVFGLSEGERYQQIKPLLADLLDILNSPARASLIFLKFLQVDLGAWSPWGKFVRRRKEIYELLQAEIEDKRANPKKQGNDILSLMLSACDEEGEPMNDDRLKDELMTLLIVGHETTATALTWAFYWLEKSPEAKEKLLQEIDSLGKNADPIEVSKQPYLTAFCQEALRLYPISVNSFARIANQDMEIMGRKFAAETAFIINIYGTHHREDLYPNSKQFKPERFLERQYSSSEFIPFGGGARLCLGYALAMLEIKLVLAAIASKYNFELADNRPIKPVRNGIVITPSNGIPLVMTGLR